MGFIPKGGESFEYGNFRFSVVEMDGKRVARVKVQRLRSAPVENENSESQNALPPSKDSKPAGVKP